jgi:glycosyltransferase involved in cell wall biosynthesis
MRILMVTNYYEPDQGGASVLLTRLAKGFQRRGHEVTVLTSLPHYPQGRVYDGYRGKLVVVENREGIRVIQTWLWATPSPRISRKLISQISFMFTAAVRGIAIPRPDIVFIESQPIFSSLAGVFLSRIKRAPYALDVPDLWPDHLLTVGTMTEQHPIYRLARWVVDNTYRGAAGIGAASPAWAKAIEHYIGPNGKTAVTYSGTDLKHFYPGQDTSAFRQKYNLGDSKLVSFIGTFATQYDFETMLAVAKHFIQRSDVRFVFFGSGSQSEFLRQHLADDNLTNVRWIDWIDHAEIPLGWVSSYITFWAMRDQALYRGTIPAKLYEAMASGVPIVAASEDVAADIIRESGGGIAVPFTDVDGMTQAIQRLLDNPALRQQYAEAAHAYARKHFDAESVISAYEAVLLSSVGQ